MHHRPASFSLASPVEPVYCDRRADVSVRCGSVSRSFVLNVRDDSDWAALAGLTKELRAYDVTTTFRRPTRAVEVSVAVGTPPTASLVINLTDAESDEDAVQGIADALLDLARPRSFREPGTSAREMFARSLGVV